MTYRVELLVREVVDSELVALYVSDDLELPFVPTMGMQFKQGTSTWLWETQTDELMPKVEAVTYNLDENLFVCVFSVNESLSSSFWSKIEKSDLEHSVYLSYFQAR